MVVFFSALILNTSVFAADEKTALEVSVLPLSKLLISAKNSAPASIISLNHATISAEITGRIVSIKTEAGDYVKKGQILASIDCRTYEFSKKQARAGLKVAKTQSSLAKKQFVRNQGLLRQGTIPRELYDQADANQQTALADIELKKVLIESAKLAVSRCKIYAPYSGQITQRMTQKGQLVTSGTPLLKLLQTDKLEIKASLSPAEVKHLKESPLLDFVSGTQRYKAVLRSIIQTIDETTRIQEVRLSLPSDTSVAAGLSGRLEWTNKNTQIPADFMLRRGNQLGVMIVADSKKDNNDKGRGKAKFFGLPDAKEGQPASVDLPDNTLIVDLNRYRVRDDQAIRWNIDNPSAATR